MYTDDLISELQSWKNPTAEVTIDGFDIDKVTCSSRGNGLVLVSSNWVKDEDRENFENEIAEIQEEKDNLQAEIDSLEERVEDMTWVITRMLSYMEEHRETLESSYPNSTELNGLISEANKTLDDNNYSY